MTLHIDLNVPASFRAAQAWYPERELLEHVAAQAVQDYIRNVIDMHNIYEGVRNA